MGVIEDPPTETLIDRIGDEFEGMGIHKDGRSTIHIQVDGDVICGSMEGTNGRGNRETHTKSIAEVRSAIDSGMVNLCDACESRAKMMITIGKPTTDGIRQLVADELGANIDVGGIYTKEDLVSLYLAIEG